MLRLWKWLRQRIRNVCIRVYLALLDITIIHELANKVVPHEYMLVLLVLSRFLGLCYSTIVITIYVQRIGRALDHTKIHQKLLIQTASFAASEAAIYSASVADADTVS